MGGRGDDKEFEAFAAAAQAHFAVGSLSEAQTAYRAALALHPGDPRVLHNLGVVAASALDPANAIAWFDAALALEPRYALVYYNRARAYDALGDRRKAIADFARVTAIEPDHYASHRALAFHYLAEGDRGRALDHFARTYELRRGQDRTGIAAKSLSHANRTKLRHDAEQFRYLAATRRDGARFEAMARSYEAVCQAAPAGVFELTQEERARLGGSFNTAIASRGAPELPDRALSTRTDRMQLLRAYTESRDAVWFDRLLTPQAFASLRRYLLESTIWHDFSHIDGFVASYLEDGLACPLLLQVADELRALFPDLLDEHPLTQAWAFKAVEPRSVIEAHADDAAVSVNFWMTPAQANHAPGLGGMAVCLTPPPSDWSVADYEADKARSVIFLEQNGADRLVVPYRENRAVLFRSRLLHASEQSKFSVEYECHRINLTLLFGHGPNPAPCQQVMSRI